MNNSKQHYGWLAISLHWLTAICVIGLFALGFWMVDLGYYDQWYKPAPALHKSIGICLFIVMLARIAWRLKQVQPEPLSTHTALEVKAGHMMHLTLYIMLIAIMLSGYLISTADGRAIEVFELFSVPALGSLIENQEDLAGGFHKYAAYTLIALVVMHAAAALKHHIIDKDNTLKRMLGRSD